MPDHGLPVWSILFHPRTSDVVYAGYEGAEIYRSDDGGERWEQLPVSVRFPEVTIGPGAFTGLRVGLATARGISLATGAPCIGLTSTETLAAALVKDELNESILAVIDSKRTDIYSQAFIANTVPISEPSALALEKLSDYYRTHCCTEEYWTLVGDAQGIVAPHLIEAGWKVRQSSTIFPDAEILHTLLESNIILIHRSQQPARPLFHSKSRHECTR